MEMNLSIIKEKLEIEISNYYIGMLDIVDKENVLEINLPVFLDDSTRYSIFLSKNKSYYSLSSNLYYYLEESISIKTKTKKNILKDYLKNPKEFKELKDALIDNGIKANKLNLEYIVNDPKYLLNELIIYSELTKSFYNSLYHQLIKRLVKNHESYNVFYKNFSNIIKKLSDSFDLHEYSEERVSTNPIYKNKNLIISAGKDKDIDGLAKLFVDINIIKNSEKIKGILFIEGEQKENSKIHNMYKEFEKMGFKIKELTVTNEDILEQEIRNEVRND